ncbi:MAG: SDR family oxidoreductase [Actinomycetota bacterium]|nr:SDR family oxidoreductase [Actinomycetota bacterium]
MNIFLTGSSGYVGGRLAPLLISKGHHLRCLLRTPAKVQSAEWAGEAEIVKGNLDQDLTEALRGIEVAIYLVHSIGNGDDWENRERELARNFAKSSQKAGVKRIVYLGGLGDDSTKLSRHLKSRHDVGKELAALGTEVVELRAAVIIGSGSASFEMLRYLTEVLPVMVTPKWVRTICQPISIRDVLTYLTNAIESSDPIGGIYEIGGPDQVTYAEMMNIYAGEAGLIKRRIVTLPLLSLGLSSLWVGFVTPVPSSIAKPLVESLANQVLVNDANSLILGDFPKTPLRVAIQRALGAEVRSEIPTRFDDADLDFSSAIPTDPPWSGGTKLSDVRSVVVKASRESIWKSITAIGGDNGWYGGEFLWEVRGILDQVVGGPGLRRGRRNPDTLAVGEPLDFWRVSEVVQEKLLILNAEMRLPGKATLEWEIEEASTDGFRVTQTARFTPKGLLGRLYWYSVAPFHTFVFPGMLDGIADDAVTRDLRRQ